MPTMDIPPFAQRVKISDVRFLTNTRLHKKFVLSEQAEALAAYMFHPASEESRSSFRSILRLSPEPLRLNLKGMRRIQYRWLRVADVFHLYYDLAIGAHQSRRGGITLSKAVYLAAKNTKSIGTSEPTFWCAWKAFKDVAHLVTAAVMVLANARIVLSDDCLTAFQTDDGAEPATRDQLSPFHMVLLMPDLVLGVAQSFEKFALSRISSRVDAGIDRNTLWRIPDVNVVPVSPPARNIRSIDKAILNARRAGNRGARNRPAA